jgi:hypothetical protein
MSKRQNPLTGDSDETNQFFSTKLFTLRALRVMSYALCA